MYVVHKREGRDFLCRVKGEPLPPGEALKVILAAIDAENPPALNEQAMTWTASAADDAAVTCPACKRAAAR